MQNISFSINSDAVRAGVEQRAQMRARGDFQTMRVRASRGRVRKVATRPRLHRRTWHRAHAAHLLFPGFVRAVHDDRDDGRLRRVATMVTNAVMRETPPEKIMMDQYAVGNEARAQARARAPFVELIYSVAISNDTTGRPGARFHVARRPTGHYERLSYWSHIGGRANCSSCTPSSGRPTLADHGSVEGGLTTAAGVGHCRGVFGQALVIMALPPDPHFAFVTRVLDYVAIYVGITVSTTADIAVATRGFQNVPYETVADLPVAAAIIITFFVWRRWLTPLDETWEEHRHRVNAKKRGDCSLCLGLFSRGHMRRPAHATAGKRQVYCSSFANFFMAAPSGVCAAGRRRRVRGAHVADLGLRARRLWHVRGPRLGVARRPFARRRGYMFCVPTKLGAGVMNSHAVWHVIAILSAACTVASREFALSHY